MQKLPADEARRARVGALLLGALCLVAATGPAAARLIATVTA